MTRDKLRLISNIEKHNDVDLKIIFYNAEKQLKNKTILKYVEWLENRLLEYENQDIKWNKYFTKIKKYFLTFIIIYYTH